MNRIGFILTSLLVALALASSMLFVVDQRQFGVVFALGQIKTVITEPGLYFRLPLVQNVEYQDRRILTIDTPEPVRPASTPRMGGGKLPDRLHFALIRASGCNPNAPGAAELFAQWPSSAELRGNPAAKRALWPRLRRLRRSASE